MLGSFPRQTHLQASGCLHFSLCRLTPFGAFCYSVEPTLRKFNQRMVTLLLILHLAEAVRTLDPRTPGGHLH